MKAFSPELLDSTRAQALGLYRSLQTLTAGYGGEEQREVLSEALEEVVACVEEMEAVSDHLFTTNLALEQAREQAEERGRRYQDLFDSAPCGYLLTSPTGMIREANRAAADLLRVRQDLLTGKPLVIFFQEAERLGFHEKVRNVSRLEEVQNWAVKLLPRRGEPLQARVSIGALRNGAGEVTELRWMIQLPAEPLERDIRLLDAVEELRSAHASSLEVAERRIGDLEAENARLREQLGEKSRTADSLVERITDLEARLNRRTAMAREALRVQNSAARYIAKSCAEPLRHLREESAAMVRELEECVPDGEKRRLRHIQRRVEELSGKMEAVEALVEVDAQPVQCQTVNTPVLVAEVMDSLAGQCAGRALDVRLGHLPPCDGDPKLLATLFRHLLSNALKFTRYRDPAEIEVGCRAGGRQMVWFVRDNGIGFRKDQEHRLFLPFQNLHRCQGYEGAGIGLAVVRQIVHRHGGRVWAEGRENGGTTFFFTLGHGQREA